MFEKLEDEYGIQASKEIILESIVKNSQFKGENGKFDKRIFKSFLSQNGLNEKKYFKELSQDVIATMVIETIAISAPTNINFVEEVSNFKAEKRHADVIKISANKIKNIKAPSKKEISEFYENNKEKYQAPEIREISYLSFTKKDLIKNSKISNTEIKDFYETNKDSFIKAENRDFLHVLFEEEEQAKNFLTKLNSLNKSKIEQEFTKLAKKDLNKDEQTISIKEITKEDLVPELANKTFSLSLNEYSEVLESPLGYHIFLLTNINKASAIELAEAKEHIIKELSLNREENLLKDKIAQIDDELLTTNSLEKVAKKFGLKLSKKPVKIDQIGQDLNGKLVDKIKQFSDFANNSFALKEDQTSRVFNGKNDELFYAINVDEIIPNRQKTLKEVKAKIIKQLLSKKKEEALDKLAQKIFTEVKKNPKLASQIASKYNVQFSRNLEFPRVYYINMQNRQIPYQNKFLDELFDIQIGETTSILPAGSQELVIGILKEIKTPKIDSQELIKAAKKSQDSFKNEILQEFNKYLLKKNPVEINDKVFGNTEEQN